MKKKPIGALIIASAIIWGMVIIGCALVLRGTEYKEDVSLILFGGVMSHLILIWGPMGFLLGKNKK